MNFKKMISVLLLFCFSFGAGSLAASVKEQRSRPAAAAAASADGNWGLSFQAEGKPPTANATADELMQYNASYAQMTDEKLPSISPLTPAMKTAIPRRSWTP